tara:strand:+ start:15073 stop:15780 length:708 start_codon:yes stop_codon:yes gene_type:complete
MSQHDYNIANQTFPNTRTDFNSVFGAISTQNSGATEPTATSVYLTWADTAASLMKFRNAADSAWVTWATTDGKLLSADGSAATPGMAFSSDVNTGAFRPTTDIYAISTGGNEAVRWDASQNMTAAGSVTALKFSFGAPTELTIATGIVTATKSNHTIDTEGDAATDDLITINGGSDGDILVLRAANGSRVPTVKDSSGNILTEGDFVMNAVDDTITLMYVASFSKWVEISRSNNG